MTGRKLHMAFGAMLHEKRAEGILSTLGDAAKGMGGLLMDYGFKLPVSLGVMGGVPLGMLWYTLAKAKRSRTNKERMLENEIQFYRDAIPGFGEDKYDEPEPEPPKAEPENTEGEASSLAEPDKNTEQNPIPTV